MRKVTPKGSITLYFYAKAVLQEDNPNASVKNDALQEILGMDAGSVSLWSHGKKLLVKIEHYAALADALGPEIDTLFQIATEEWIPGIVDKWEIAIDKRARKARSTKSAA